MFRIFSDELFHSGPYEVKGNQLDGKMTVEHVNAETRKRWCKVTYEVDVDRESDTYTCECGMFQHSGILCRHVLKVSIIYFCTTSLETRSCFLSESSGVFFSQNPHVFFLNSTGHASCQAACNTKQIHIKEVDQKCTRQSTGASEVLTGRRKCSSIQDIDTQPHIRKSS